MRLRLLCLIAVGVFVTAAPALAQSQSGSTSGGNSSSFNQGGNQGAQQAGSDSSSASQIGDTDTVVDQRSDVESGNAQSGSQVTGVGRPSDPKGAGTPGGPGAIVPGTGGEQTDTTSGPAEGPFRNIQTPLPAGAPVNGPIAGVPQSAPSASDWAVTTVVALAMLVGVLVGIRKLPRSA